MFQSSSAEKVCWVFLFPGIGRAPQFFNGIPWNRSSMGQAAPSVRTPGEVKLLVCSVCGGSGGSCPKFFLTKNHRAELWLLMYDVYDWLAKEHRHSRLVCCKECCYNWSSCLSNLKVPQREMCSPLSGQHTKKHCHVALVLLVASGRCQTCA